MKRFLISLLFLTASIVALAEERPLLITKNLREIDPISENITPVHVLDKNNDACALIVVTLKNSLDGPLILTCQNFGIEKREQKAQDKIHFYISTKVKSLLFTCTGYKMIDPIPVQLEKGKVYGIEISSPDGTDFNAEIPDIKQEEDFRIYYKQGTAMSFEQRLALAESVYISMPLYSDDDFYSTTTFNTLKDTFERRGKRVIHISPDHPFPRIRKTSDYNSLYKDPDWCANSVVINPVITDTKSRKFKFRFQCFDLYQKTEYNWSYQVNPKDRIKSLDIAFANACRSIPVITANKALYKQFQRPGNVANWDRKDFIWHAKNNGLELFEGIYRLGRQEYYIEYINQCLYVVASNNYINLEGDVVGELTPTATPNVFLGRWAVPYSNERYYDTAFKFNAIGVEAHIGDKTIQLIKVWPTAQEANSYIRSKWSGTGWAINDGYIITNNHVVENAKKIIVNVQIYDSSIKVPASVIATDPINDLAVIQIEKAFIPRVVPYSLKREIVPIGTPCYAFGYPRTQILGDDIKLTEGVISSRNGFQGSENSYQTTASIHPGNSGGPLLDNDGNIIGVINSGIEIMENVGYAIKAEYVFRLLEANNLSGSIPIESNISTIPNSEDISKFVFLIECSNN